MHPMLNVAVKAARRAGRIINRASIDLDTIKVSRKQQNDFVTEVDRASEDAIIETLRQAFPAHLILAEESGLTAGPQSKPVEAAATVMRSAAQSDVVSRADHVWIIDPLDGTTNFIHGFPQYCISIALMERGSVTQGLVYDPNRDELFSATKGAGAYLNDRRVRVTRRTKLDEAMIGTGFPYRKIDDLDRYLAMFKVITQRTGAVRRPGAAALDLAYVACGRYDAFFEMGLAPWDVAAGALLVTEAGGLIGDFGGDANHIFGEEVVAGTPKVFVAMLPLLNGTVTAQ